MEMPFPFEGRDPDTVAPESLLHAVMRQDSLRLEALRLAIGQGGSDAIVREKAEAFLAFLKGEPAPEKAGE